MRRTGVVLSAVLVVPAPSACRAGMRGRAHRHQEPGHHGGNGWSA